MELPDDTVEGGRVIRDMYPIITDTQPSTQKKKEEGGIIINSKKRVPFFANLPKKSEGHLLKMKKEKIWHLFETVILDH